jgi:hypothetical protein
MPELPLRIEVEPWQFHEHPSSGHKVFLDMNGLTVHTPQGGMIVFQVPTLPNRRWGVLRDQQGTDLPLRVYRDGYIAEGMYSRKGRVIVEWRPVDSKANSSDNDRRRRHLNKLPQERVVLRRRKACPSPRWEPRLWEMFLTKWLDVPGRPVSSRSP